MQYMKELKDVFYRCAKMLNIYYQIPTFVVTLLKMKIIHYQ